MTKERSETEKLVLRALCSVLPNTSLYDIKENDISELSKKIDSGEITFSSLRGFTADELYDFIMGQMRFF